MTWWTLHTGAHQDDGSVRLRPDPEVRRNIVVAASEIDIADTVDEIRTRRVTSALLRNASHSTTSIAVEIVCARRRVVQIMEVETIPVVGKVVMVAADGVDVRGGNLRTLRLAEAR